MRILMIFASSSAQGNGDGPGAAAHSDWIDFWLTSGLGVAPEGVLVQLRLWEAFAEKKFGLTPVHPNGESFLDAVNKRSQVIQPCLSADACPLDHRRSLLRHLPGLRYSGENHL
jgi:hypothetical protein